MTTIEAVKEVLVLQENKDFTQRLVMAGSGYAYRGSSTYRGVPSLSDEWSKTSYASETDHLCRPVIIDAEGRKLPIILATPSYRAQSYVAKVEAIVEHVHTPLVIGYRHSSPPKIVPVKDYGFKHCSPPMDEPVKDYGYKVEPWKDYGYKNSFPTKAEPVKDYGYKHCSPPMDEPAKDYGYKVEPWKDYAYKNSFPTKAEPMKESGYKIEPVKDYKHKPEPVKGYGYKPEPMRDYGYTSEPVKDYGYTAEPVKDYGYKVEPMKDYGYKAEPIKDYGYKTEPIRDYGYKAEPMKEYGKVEPMNDYKYANDKWHRPSSPIHDHPQEVEDYTETCPSKRFEGRLYNNHSLNASSNIPKEHSSDCSVKQPENVPRVSPNRDTWSAPPPSHHDATLSKYTSDLGTAVENLKEALKPLSVSSPTPRFSVPISTTVPKKDAYTETIDSREAARRYANLTSRPQATEEKYTKTIDSREAARKYGGAFVG